MLLEKICCYWRQALTERAIIRHHILFIENLEVYKESHKNPEVINEIMDMGNLIKRNEEMHKDDFQRE